MPAATSALAACAALLPAQPAADTAPIKQFERQGARQTERPHDQRWHHHRCDHGRHGHARRHTAVTRRASCGDCAADDRHWRRGFSAALALVRASDMIATVPERHTLNLREGMASFTLPVSVAKITVSLLWHLRQHADQGHRRLRACVRACVPGLG